MRYERAGQPKVIYNQAPGQPVVRIERTAQEPDAQAQTGSTTPAAMQHQGMTAQERARAEKMLIVPNDQAAAATNQARYRHVQ